MFQAVETHSGEPMRVITGGVPHIPGNTVYEQMRWLEKNDDQHPDADAEGAAWLSARPLQPG
jgi:proline racemase